MTDLIADTELVRRYVVADPATRARRTRSEVLAALSRLAAAALSLEIVEAMFLSTIQDHKALERALRNEIRQRLHYLPQFLIYPNGLDAAIEAELARILSLPPKEDTRP